jgi:hypothetical protein
MVIEGGASVYCADGNGTELADPSTVVPVVGPGASVSPCTDSIRARSTAIGIPYILENKEPHFCFFAGVAPFNPNLYIHPWTLVVFARLTGMFVALNVSEV